MIFHLKQQMGLKGKFVQFSTPSVEMNKAKLDWKIMLDLSGQSKFMFALSEFPFVPAMLLLFPLPPASQLLGTWQLSVVHVSVCVYALSKQQFRLPGVATSIHSLTSPLLSTPLSPSLLICCSSDSYLLNHLPTHTHTPCRAELPSGSYVYLTKNAGMPIKRAQKVVLNMEQVLWLGNTSRIATLCEKEAHKTTLYNTVHQFTPYNDCISLPLSLFNLRPATFLSVPN